uniref:Putative ovule protein n=1 Tax=Solanum chacoense TaxID=4108 RepID=A0A0V0HWW7_SOLCH
MATINLYVHRYTTSKYAVPLQKYNLRLEHLYVVPMNSLKRQKYNLFELFIFVYTKNKLELSISF